MNSTVIKITQYVLGAAMLVFGANKFLHFMPQPDLSEDAANFMGALGNSGYIFPILGVVYIISGLCLLLNKAVPFALLALVPVSINIVAFHMRFDPKGVLFSAIVAVLNIVLISAHWNRFKSLFN